MTLEFARADLAKERDARLAKVGKTMKMAGFRPGKVPKNIVDVMLIPLNPDRFSAKGLQILKDEIKNIKKQYKKDLHYKIFLNKFSGNTILSDKTLQTVFNDESESGRVSSNGLRSTGLGRFDSGTCGSESSGNR